MTDKQLFELCQRYGKEARLARNKFVALLPEVYRRRLYRRKGFGSIFEFAAKLGGVSKNVVEEVIRVDRKLEEMPKLKSMIADVGLSKIRVVTGVATKETDKEWATKVSTLTKSALLTHVKESRPGASIFTTPEKSIFEKEFEHFQAKLDPKIILKLKIIKQKMGQGTTWNDVFSRLTDLPTPQPQKNPRPSNPESRPPSTKQKREALAKTSGKCSVPGCNRPAQEIHHKKPWAKYRSHDDLQPLCADHHELAHQSDSTIDQKFRQYKFQFS